MKWEIPLLLGFLLFFSTWVSFPVTNNYYFDSNNVKHYILTPALSSYGNDVDNLTNVLFIKYENPWETQSEIIALQVTGIFLLLLVHEFIQQHLIFRILELPRFNYRKYFFFVLKSDTLKDINKGYWDPGLSIFSPLDYSLFDKFREKKEKRYSFIIFFIIIMVSVIHSDEKLAYGAAASVFTDGGANTSIAACTSPTTLVSAATSFPAGDNLIIASVQAVSTDGGTEDVTATISRSGTLVQNEYAIEVGATNTQNNYMLLYQDVGAPANPTYAVTGCRSFIDVDAEAKILALSGFKNTGFVDGSSTAITSGSDVQIASVTGGRSGDNIIIASIQIDNGGTAQTIAAGNIKLKNGAGTTLTSNQFSMQFGTTSATDIQVITLIYEEIGAGSNPTYSVTINPAQSANAEAKILVFQSTKSNYVDGGSVGVGTTATQLTTTTSTFASEEIAAIAASEFDDTGGTAETYTATTGHELREGTTAQAGNQYTLRAFAAGGNNAGDGHRHSLIWRTASSGTNQNYEVRAVESAAGQNGASQLLVFKISSTSVLLNAADTPTLSDTATVKQKIFPSDTPTLSDTATVKQKLFPSDTPTLSDTATVKQRLFPSDTPTLSDSVVLMQILFPNDTPTLSESVTVIQKLFPADAPILSESATAFLIHSLSADDNPTLDESIVIKQSLFPDDTPTLSDSATSFLIHALSADDAPTLSDSVILKQNIFTDDTPTLSDSAIIKQNLFVDDTLTVDESVILMQSIPIDDTPLLSDSADAFLVQSLSADDTLAVDESVILMQSIPIDDTPTLSDSADAFLIQGLSTNDTPTFFEAVTAFLIQTFTSNDTPSLDDSVILRQDLFPTDILSITDSASAQKRTITTGGGGGGDLTPPSIVSSTITLQDTQNPGSGTIIGENNGIENLSQSRPINVGQQINLRFEINESGGINSVTHAALYMGKGDLPSELSQSNTFIRFDKGEPFKVSDPDKIFSDVSFAIITKDASSFVLRFDMTFAKPVEKSSILFRTWDLARNSNEIFYLNALEVVDTSSLLPTDISQAPTQEPNDNRESVKAMTAEQKLLIEQWNGYSLESISDSKLLRLLGIISPESEDKVTIPQWFRNNVGKWLLEEKISFTEFVDALEYMYEKRIIR